MAQQTINIGTTANDGTGDPIRSAFDKANDNFTELYGGAGAASYTAGDGITLNTLEFDLDAALTTVTSIFNTSLQIGRDSGGDWIDFGTDNQVSIYVNNSEQVRVESDGDLHVEGDVIAYSTTVASDEALKTDINTIESALDKLKSIKGVTFNYKRNNKNSGGVIAQDVEKVFPEFIHEQQSLDGATTFKTVDYNGLIGLLIEAVKELNDKCNNCKKD